jgi:hypothetical protein
MNHRHTPGPWNDNAPEVIADHHGNVIASMAETMNDDLDTPWSEEIMEANCQLLASAPDLLAALIEMRKVFDPHRPKSAEARACGVADRAIAEAITRR